MKKTLLSILLLLKAVCVTPYVVTSYYELVESGATTSTKYVAAPTGTATISGLTTSSSASDHLFTYVHVQLPSGVGEPISSQSTALNTEHAVLVTYSLCTNTSTSTLSTNTHGTVVYLAVPPVTKTIPIPLPSNVAETLTPTATQAMEVLNLNPDPTSTQVAILNPTDVDPIEFAYLSDVYQPKGCVVQTVTSAIDYRNACKNGPEARKPQNSEVKMSCGELNPCCFDCILHQRDCDDESACGLPHVSDGYGDYGFCADGYTYYSGGATKTDRRFTEDAPTMTAGEWTDEQRENDRNGRKSIEPTSTSSTSGAADRAVWGGMRAFFTCWVAGMLIISASGLTV